MINMNIMCNDNKVWICNEKNTLGYFYDAHKYEYYNE